MDRRSKTVEPCHDGRSTCPPCVQREGADRTDLEDSALWLNISISLGGEPRFERDVKALKNELSLNTELGINLGDNIFKMEVLESSICFI